MINEKQVLREAISAAKVLTSGVPFKQFLDHYIPFRESQLQAFASNSEDIEALRRYQGQLQELNHLKSLRDWAIQEDKRQ